jgi:hypothetical protein
MDSSDKHGIQRGDQVHAILNATFSAELVGEAEVGRIMLYIGPAHPQTERELEILVHEFPDTGDEARIFHAMELGPKFRAFREEHTSD